MSSPRPRDAGHGLGLAPGRELVFCHACQNEWYRDEHSGSMRCPTCASEAVEIVDPDSDPRPHQDPLPILGHRHHSHRHDNSDPDEEDIEEHVTHHPGGFFMRQAVFDSRSRPRGEQAGSPGRRRPADASNNQEVLQRFGELLAGLGVGMPPPGGRVPGLNRGRPDNDPLADDAPPPPPPLGFFGAPRVRTFRAGPLSGASITISTGVPVRPEAGGPADFGPYVPTAHHHQHHRSPDYSPHRPYQPMLGPRPLVLGRSGHSPTPSYRRGAVLVAVPHRANTAHGDHRVFGSILSNGPLPAAAGDRRGAGEGVPLEFGLGLQELLTTLFDPTRAVRGDAVYTQEALDRIITTLMENNPQSNAAPPASQAAIERLQKKKVDSEMLGNDGRAECTICIDDLHLGDEVTVLPCKHWFHGECVVLWLKEHNTCPVCRAPIEKRNTDAATGSSPQDNATSATRPQGSAHAAPPSNPSSAPGGANTRYMGFPGQQWGQPQPPPGPPPPEFATATRPQMGGTSESSRGATSNQSFRSQRATNADRLERLNRVRAAAELPPETSMSRTYGPSSSSLPGEGAGQPGSRRTSNSPPSMRTSWSGHQQPQQAGGGSGASGRRQSQHQQGGSLARGRGVRDRSPSHSRRTRDSVSGGSGSASATGSGVMEAGLHWLRDHLGGGSGSSSNNGDRDRRRS